MRRLIVHVGTHKTGSTAIQRALRSASRTLLRDGLLFVPTPRQIWQLETGREYDSGAAEAIRSSFLSSLQGQATDHTVVMSCEAFSGDIRTGYANADALARTLEHMSDGFETTVVVYLRRQDSFVESAYTQLIHQGGSQSFDEYLVALPKGAFDWEEFLATYATRFAKESIAVRRYDKSLLPRRESILEDFAQVIGASVLPEAPGDESPNRGYTRDALEVARLCNPHLDAAQQHELRIMLQQTSAKAPFESYTLFSGRQRAEFLARFSASNEHVAREYLGLADGVLFPAPDDPDEHEYPGLTVEVATRVLAQALVGHAERTPAETSTTRLARKVERRLWRALERTPGLKSRAEESMRRRGLL